ncbi:hypothetical protein RvY_18833 [Ramazzottius varieornatus]|uniref:ADAMTS cysteine-rich domain-containing protein n=1 Tax=Ramazzottius varieornatus TaxID=947166 RepID=A0A1D1W8L2_RAMVA|nr:hypothetical protein RvY_18833 [Ramazzottius varieornatus]
MISSLPFLCCVTGTLCIVVGTAKARSLGNSESQQYRKLHVERLHGAKKSRQFDDSPIVHTETLEAWSERKEGNGDQNDEDEEVEEAVVSNDDEQSVGLPSTAEKAPSVVIEKEKDHLVWAMWGPWSPCSGTCGPGHTRKRGRKCSRGACHGGITEEEVESCNSKPCQADIAQASSETQLPRLQP